MSLTKGAKRKKREVEEGKAFSLPLELDLFWGGRGGRRGGR